MKIVTAAEMKQLEAEAEKLGITSSQLMENAGRAVAEARGAFSAVYPVKKFWYWLAPATTAATAWWRRATCASGVGTSLSTSAPQRQADDANLKLALERGITAVEAEEDANQAQFS